MGSLPLAQEILNTYTDIVFKLVDLESLSHLDAPSVVRVQNSTVYPDLNVEQFAILECAVSNTEENLEVWINWTTIDGKKIEKEHVTFENGDVFYLLLYNATAGDYMCQLFSTYSPKYIEDMQVAAVVFSGQLIFRMCVLHVYLYVQ